tara:strand:+ start:2738 stop:3151 length:414 start_codon:yes stop_codon:yes gene_type:complete
MQQSALDLVEDVRSKAEDHFGQGRVRLSVDSAYRCPEHNAAVGGAKQSQHMLGLALDLHIEIAQDSGGKGKRKWVPVPVGVFEQIARRSKLLGGIGRDDGRQFVHIDSRPRTTAMPAQWAYKGSKEVAYYKPGTVVA